jgi:MFS family permease
MSTVSLPANRLRDDRDFLLFLASRSVAVLGSAISAVALPLLVFRLSDSPLVTSFVAAVQVLPYLLFGLVAGAVADRAPRRTVMVAAQGVAAAALLSVPVVSKADQLHTAHVVAVAALVATSFVWFDAAAFGALPRLVGTDRIVAANSAIWTVTTLLGVGAPALGGLLVAVFGAPRALALDAGSYVVAGLLLAAVGRSMDPAPTADTADARVGTVRADIAEGLRFVFGQPLIRSLTLLGLGNSLTGGAVTALLVVLVVDGLELPADGRWYGVLLAAVALGGLLAALTLPRLSRRLPIGLITLAGLAVCPVAVLAVAAAPGPGWLLAPLVAWSLASTLVILNGITARQRLTPDRLQGRVNTTARMIAWGGAPVGALTGGALAEMVDVRQALAISAVAVAASAVAGWWSPLRGREWPGAVTEPEARDHTPQQGR